MKPSKVLLCVNLIIFILCNSCISVHKNFTMLDENFVHDSIGNIRKDGLFFIENPFVENPAKLPVIIYLNRDGTAFLSSGINTRTASNENFWKNTSIYLEELHKLNANIMHSYLTGYYAIRSDTIIIQFFIYQDQYWMRRNSLELIGSIKNDTTIELRGLRCNWCNKFYNITRPKSNSIDFEPSIKYRFVKDDQKPDSSKIWFRKKKWYLKRHNRQQNI